MKFHPAIEAILLRASRDTVQKAIKRFSPESLGYLFPEIIEEYFSVKKGTASFGEAVSKLFEGYKVNKVRLEEVDLEIQKSLSKFKLHYSIDVKREQMIKHNILVDEFTALHLNLTKFVKEVNKFYKVRGIKK